MISLLKIEQFKSIKQIQLECRRINLFIGAPNTGKSNILEALGVLSWCGQGKRPLKDFVRFNLTQYLFYDGITDTPVAIEIDKKDRIEIKLIQNSFYISSSVYRLDKFNQNKETIITASGDAGVLGLQNFNNIKFYKFKPGNYSNNTPGILEYPYGDNLFFVIYGSEKLRKWIKELFKPFGLKLVFKLHEKTFELQKEQDDEAISLPYSLASDTLQRIVFYYAAIESNQNSILIFEEPESNAFPYYVKFLSEIIALDTKNQYFITTHNPYMLSAIWEKTNKNDLAIYGTYFKDHQTKVKLLSEEELQRLFNADPFFELEELLEGQ